MWYWLSISGAILIGGILSGINWAFQQIYGSSSAMLFGDTEKEYDFGMIPVLLLKTAVSSPALFVVPKGLMNGLLIVGSGLILAIIHTLLIRQFQWVRRMNYVIFCILLGLIVGGIMGGIIGPLIRGLIGRMIAIGLLVGGSVIGGLVSGGMNWWLIFAKYYQGTSDKFSRTIFAEIVGGGILGGLIGGLLAPFSSEGYGGGLGMIVFVIVGVFLGFLFAGFWRFLQNMMIIPKWIVALFLPLLLMFWRFRTIICNHCLRYTYRLRSIYENGIRYCEHCEKEVEYTHDPGKVVLTFGDVLLTPEGRMFILADPDFEQKDQPIDVSGVYIDPKTADPRLIERFVTYIVNHPPRDDLPSVRILYQGELDDLGVNLKNVLHNTFERVQQIY